MEGQLNELEPHPAAEGARQWLISYVRRKDSYALLRLQESFASCALEGNRLAEICSETLRRLLSKEPVSDRYLLGLVWTIRDMEQKERQEAESGLVKELAGALAGLCSDEHWSKQHGRQAPPYEAWNRASTVLAQAMAAGLV